MIHHLSIDRLLRVMNSPRTRRSSVERALSDVLANAHRLVAREGVGDQMIWAEPGSHSLQAYETCEGAERRIPPPD